MDPVVVLTCAHPLLFHGTGSLCQAAFCHLTLEPTGDEQKENSIEFKNVKYDLLVFFS